MNIVVLSGRLLSDPSARELPSGEVIWALDLATDAGGKNGAAALPVPVVWSASEVPAWEKGTELAVAGVVRRRFFRSDGSTQSRTEVVATKVLEVTKRRSPDRAVAAALSSLGEDERARLRSALG
jgi:single-stranded DNA-binding protein